MITLPDSLRAAVSLFYPSSCAVCQHPAGEGEFLCPSCAAKVQRIKAPFCEKCSEPYPANFDQTFTCANCSHRELHFDTAVSAYRARGIARAILWQFKYRRAFHLRHLIRDWLLAAMDDPRLHRRHFHCIVPVPLHSVRRRERGFNQAELLASLLSNEINVPVNRALIRVRYTTTQTALDRADRMENLRNAFRLRDKTRVQDSEVLLLDDILTTGSTLSECAHVLRQAGAASVCAITAARA